MAEKRGPKIGDAASLYVVIHRIDGGTCVLVGVLGWRGIMVHGLMVFVCLFRWWTEFGWKTTRCGESRLVVHAQPTLYVCIYFGVDGTSHLHQGGQKKKHIF